MNFINPSKPENKTEYFECKAVGCDGSAKLVGNQFCLAIVCILFHDLLLRSYLYHCVWSVITAHNLTPEKRDNNYSPHP